MISMQFRERHVCGQVSMESYAEHIIESDTEDFNAILDEVQKFLGACGFEFDSGTKIRLINEE